MSRGREFDVVVAGGGVAGSAAAAALSRLGYEVAIVELLSGASAGRPRVSTGSAEGMAKLDGGPFLMGTEDDEGFPQDGEGPVRTVTLDPFYIDTRPVTNAQFAEFVNQSGYRTDAERFGWSFVFQGHLPPERGLELKAQRVAAVPWWCQVMGADYEHMLHS